MARVPRITSRAPGGLHILQLLSFGAGLGLLYLGAEGLVRGSSSLALRLGIAPLVVGLTVVAFGTSTPELVVSLVAGLRGSADVAVGNVVGSNIFNVGAVLGGAALVRALAVETRLVSREIPVMIAFSLALPVLGWDGTLSRPDAVLLCTGFLGYIAFVVSSSRAGASPPAGSAGVPESVPSPSRSAWLDTLRLVLGLVGLVAGGHLLVTASIFFARALGVPELVIGLTIVAAGTSLPELATSLVAAARRETDIAVGNVVGSNIFNIGAILGIAGMATPLRVAPELRTMEIPIMIGLALLVLPLGFTHRSLRRGEGILLVVVYLSFLVLLGVRALG